jgi:hypothetical protein
VGEECASPAWVASSSFLELEDLDAVSTRAALGLLENIQNVLELVHGWDEVVSQGLIEVELPGKLCAGGHIDS